MPHIPPSGEGRVPHLRRGKVPHPPQRGFCKAPHSSPPRGRGPTSGEARSPPLGATRVPTPQRQQLVLSNMHPLREPGPPTPNGRGSPPLSWRERQGPCPGARGVLADQCRVARGFPHAPGPCGCLSNTTMARVQHTTLPYGPAAPGHCFNHGNTVSHAAARRTRSGTPAPHPRRARDGGTRLVLSIGRAPRGGGAHLATLGAPGKPPKWGPTRHSPCRINRNAEARAASGGRAPLTGSVHSGSILTTVHGTLRFTRYIRDNSALHHSSN